MAVISRRHFASPSSSTTLAPAVSGTTTIEDPAGFEHSPFAVSTATIKRIRLNQTLRNYGIAGVLHDWNFPPDLNDLGRGYDIFGNYAYSGSSKGRIFDWRFAPDVTDFGGYSVPTCVSATSPKITESTVHTGNSALEIQTSVSNSVSVSGGYLSLFSGTLTSGITEVELRKSRRAFTIVHVFCGFNRYAFDPASAAVRKLMTSEFKLALDHYEPEDLFRAYGTHFPVEIVTGGRLDYCSSTRVLEYRSDTTIATAAKASLDLVIGSLGGGGSTETHEAAYAFDSSSDSNLLSYGGAPDKSGLIGIGTSQAELQARFADWLQSVPAALSFVKFGAPDCLRGIWTLCSDPQRRSALEAAAGEFLRQRDALNRIEADRLVDVVIAAGGSASVEADGYEKIPYDLNKGAGGAYIYACIRKEPVDVIRYGDVRPVVDLAVVWGPSAGIAAPAGFEKIPVDLNQGCGGPFMLGPFMFLCKRFGTPGVPDEGLRDLTVVGGSHPGVPAPYGYRRIEADLNEGVHGEYIYFCMI